MTDNENDFDLDNQDDFESDIPPQGASLKDAWDNNPLIKIGAVILVVAVLVGAYMIFFSAEEEANVSSVGAGGATAVKVNVGDGKIDDAYKDALEARNEQEKQRAESQGVSAMPVPIGKGEEDAISLPELPTVDDEDPLQQWRKQLDATTVAQDNSIPTQMDLPPEAPMVAMQRPQAPTPAAKMDPEAAKRLSEQMRVIIASQLPGNAKTMIATSVPSEYVVMQEELKKAGSRGGAGGAAGGVYGSDDPGGVDLAEKEVIIPAGNIAYGQLLNALNSDVPGPVLVHVLSGPFTGGRALGQFQMSDEYLILTFKAIVKDGVYYDIDGIAMDENTTLTGLRSDVDRHYFTRVILPAAASFISGYASAVAETGTTTTTTSGGGVVENDPEPDTEEELYKGLEEAADSVSDVLDENADRPITVKLAKGTTMGILFMKPVTTEDAN